MLLMHCYIRNKFCLNHICRTTQSPEMFCFSSAALLFSEDSQLNECLVRLRGYGIRSTAVLPQQQVNDPGHSAKSADGRLQLNTTRMHPTYEVTL